MSGKGKYIYKDKKLLRCGYTTGTCAALAARAAVRFLLSGSWPETERIRTPEGTEIEAAVEAAESGGTGGSHGVWAQCAVRKDAGDDPDVTNGLLIFARAEFLEIAGEQGDFPRVFIDGGAGVGRVTRAGLDQPVGAAAINSVPRTMIREAVSGLLEECGEPRRVRVTVSVPGGEKIAAKTFNPQLGIVGGISILGTSGIVRPMSEEALVDTIRAELSVLRAAGHIAAAAVPGNMGAEFLERYMERGGRLLWSGVSGAEPERLGTDSEQSEKEPRQPDGAGAERPVGAWGCKVRPVTCSNYIGATIDLAGELGFSGLLFAGHIGKLVKLGNGIMNTHSREGDGRMDTLLSCALSAGADREPLVRIQRANTTNEALDILESFGLREASMRILTERIARYLKRRAADNLETAAILFDSAGHVLGETENAGKVLAAAFRLP